MLTKPFLPVIFFCALIADRSAFAQTSDSLSDKHKAYASVINKFYSEIGPQSRLYNGKRYEFYSPSFKGSAFFMDIADWRPGSVVYDGYLYQHVDMIYDLFKDLLIIHLYHSFLKISLLSDEVESFDVMNHHFIRIINDPSNKTSPNTGFYDVLYSGKIAVFAKSKKTLQSSQNGGTIDSYFTPASTNYYLLKNGSYYDVNSQGAFLDELKDKKKEIKAYIRANKIKYRENREQAMALIAAYYDHISE